MEAKGIDLNQVWASVQRYVKQMSPYLGIFLAVLIVLDLTLGVRTLFAFADSLFMAGGVVVSIGGLAAIGKRVPDPVGEGEEPTYSFSSLAIGSGFILVLLSILIHQFI